MEPVQKLHQNVNTVLEINLPYDTKAKEVVRYEEKEGLNRMQDHHKIDTNPAQNHLILLAKFCSETSTYLNEADVVRPRKQKYETKKTENAPKEV